MVSKLHVIVSNVTSIRALRDKIDALHALYQSCNERGSFATRLMHYVHCINLIAKEGVMTTRLIQLHVSEYGTLYTKKPAVGFSTNCRLCVLIKKSTPNSQLGFTNFLLSLADRNTKINLQLTTEVPAVVAFVMI